MWPKITEEVGLATKTGVKSYDGASCLDTWSQTKLCRRPSHYPTSKPRITGKKHWNDTSCDFEHRLEHTPLPVIKWTGKRGFSILNCCNDIYPTASSFILSRTKPRAQTTVGRKRNWIMSVNQCYRNLWGLPLERKAALQFRPPKTWMALKASLWASVCDWGDCRPPCLLICATKVVWSDQSP